MRHQWDLSGWNCVTLHTVDPVRRARFFSQITRDCRRSPVPAHAPSFACVGHIRDQKAMTADLDEIEKVAAEIARNAPVLIGTPMPCRQHLEMVFRVPIKSSMSPKAGWHRGPHGHCRPNGFCRCGAWAPYKGRARGCAQAHGRAQPQTQSKSVSFCFIDAYFLHQSSRRKSSCNKSKNPRACENRVAQEVQE